ncbi:MAG: NADH-quinone oxidoreductase subunit A [Anaerolineae bacterium]|nr:NADH-quinone oxidoreductase subunit A [Anaerolineae bacterium]
MESLFAPPIAFVIYIVLVGILSGVGWLLAGPSNPNPTKSSTYASGEAPQPVAAAPGYRPFFKVALFFAILHLGVVVLASGGASSGTALYLIGLMVALVALILG